MPIKSIYDYYLSFFMDLCNILENKSFKYIYINNKYILYG